MLLYDMKQNILQYVYVPSERKKKNEHPFIPLPVKCTIKRQYKSYLMRAACLEQTRPVLLWYELLNCTKSFVGRRPSKVVKSIMIGDERYAYHARRVRTVVLKWRQNTSGIRCKITIQHRLHKTSSLVKWRQLYFTKPILPTRPGRSAI